MDNTLILTMDALLAAQLARPVNQQLNAFLALLLDTLLILREFAILLAVTVSSLAVRHAILEAIHLLDVLIAKSKMDMLAADSPQFASPMPQLLFLPLHL